MECACKRWLHEDCIDYDIVVGSDGKELLCPYCVVCYEIIEKIITLKQNIYKKFFCGL